MKRTFSLTVFSALLSTAVLSSAAYIYSCGDSTVFIVFTLLSAVYNAVMFVIFELLRKKNRVLISTLVIAALFITVSVCAGLVIDLPKGNMFQWFMDPQKFTRIYTGGIAAVTLFFGFILSASMYYFTLVQFRAIYIFLICMCPFSLFAKTFTDIPVLYTVIVTTLFFTLLMVSGGSRGVFSSGSGVSGSAVINRILAITGFVTVVTMISAFFPKLEYAPYRKEFDELITGISIGANSGVGNYNEFSMTSSNIGANSNDKDKIIFRAYGEVPQYIKRQCFNYYNGEENSWGYYGDANTGSPNWLAYTFFEDPAQLYEVMDYNGGATAERKCVIASDSDPLRALYSQENTLSIEFDESFSLVVYRTELSEYFLVNGLAEYPMRCYLEWADFEIDPRFSELFTDERARALADDGVLPATSYLYAKEEARKHDKYLLDPEVRLSCYKSEKGFNEVNRLTNEIISGCVTDYEKAKAIEQYFKSDMFVYDENFATSDASPENFIFRTRRGICSNYATAMTLMCREAGLTSRYVEGFMRGTYSIDEHCYPLTVGDAHAYVQVWIDGYGWTDFDPTSNNIDGGYNSATFLFIGITAVIVALLVVGTVFIMPRIRRRRFMSRLGKANTRLRYIMAYERISADFNSFAGIKQSSMTPCELAVATEAEIGLDISGFISDYEKCVYGGYENGVSSDCSHVCDEYLAHIRIADKQRRKDRRDGRKKKK